MREFKVIAGVCVGRRKDFKQGDTVKETDFPEGNAYLLVLSGFLKEIGGGQTPESAPKVDENLTNLRPDEPVEPEKIHTGPGMENPAEITKAGDNKNSLSGIDNTSVETIIEDLVKAKVKFDKNSTKEELYKLWLAIL